MRLISCHNGRLLASALAEEQIIRPRFFTTGLEAIDELLPQGGFLQGAIHEILTHPRHGLARFFALLLARSISPGAIVWSDLRAELFPPAIAAMGVELDRLYLLQPSSTTDQIWALAECLRCRGVGATIAHVDRLSRIEARRLQLAAEHGGGVGILLRSLGRNSSIYAAATRWLVAPARGERTTQRWTIQLLHGHGGRVGKTVILEHHRDTRTIHAHPVHPASQLANRPAVPAAPARATA